MMGTVFCRNTAEPGDLRDGYSTACGVFQCRSRRKDLADFSGKRNFSGVSPTCGT